jgi:hypothetical protein
MRREKNQFLEYTIGTSVWRCWETFKLKKIERFALHLCADDGSRRERNLPEIYVQIMEVREAEDHCSRLQLWKQRCRISGGLPAVPSVFCVCFSVCLTDVFSNVRRNIEWRKVDSEWQIKTIAINYRALHSYISWGMDEEQETRPKREEPTPKQLKYESQMLSRMTVAISDAISCRK